ncbi:MAG: DNA primase [Flavobacteriales bacterium]|nr:MAG: DNA primase [Flavobacteriales bacterium]
MISKLTIDRIFETARIEEVVADFVQLKRVGGNYRGLSPFTNEKTPSFYVSPAKQIYKCFSSGSGGNVVGFLMELEKMTYPEALRHLANRYGIEIEETERTDEDKEAISRRESLYLLNEFVAKYFSKVLKREEEGMQVGLAYFKERGFSNESIERFELGYSLSQSDALLQEARSKGHSKELLIELGLVMENERGAYDRFRERVIFPIHNLSGRIAGFGGRTLRSDKKIAKYINSPESEIYSKSKLLYGLFQARKEVVRKDLCYLVEGYTDVISFHQAGVENTIATSGTSLTEDQVRQIKRLTNNVAILFDGDSAGIKASMRGIDMFLKEGLHVKTLLFPDGQDPDSFARSKSSQEVMDYLAENVRDFLVFKIEFLLAEAADSPIQKAEAIREVIRTLALIPSDIDRDVYIRESARLLQVEEKLIYSETDRLRQKTDQKSPPDRRPTMALVKEVPTDEGVESREKEIVSLHQERHLAHLLLTYGTHICRFMPIVDGKFVPGTEETEESVASYIVQELETDGLVFQHPVYASIFLEFQKAVLENQIIPDAQYFLRHEDQSIVREVIHLSEGKYKLSDWNSKGIYPKSDLDTLERNVRESVLRFKEKMLHHIIELRKNDLQIAEDTMEIMSELYQLLQLQKTIQRLVGQEV